MTDDVEDLLDRDDVEGVRGRTDSDSIHTEACRHARRLDTPLPVEDVEESDLPLCRRCGDTVEEPDPADQDPYKHIRRLDALDPEDVGLDPLSEDDGRVEP